MFFNLEERAFFWPTIDKFKISDDYFSNRNLSNWDFSILIFQIDVYPHTDFFFKTPIAFWSNQVTSSPVILLGKVAKFSSTLMEYAKKLSQVALENLNTAYQTMNSMKKMIDFSCNQAIITMYA